MPRKNAGAQPPAAQIVTPRYSAPALEKGLDILELLVAKRQPLTTSMISQSLGRSTSELFRMIQVLEYRGFITQTENGEGFVPTDRLFSLGMEQAPVKNLLELSLPVMRELSATIGQSSHLAVRSGGDIVVVARMESEEQIGFAVRVGYRKSFVLTGSGAVLFAFQPEKERERWLLQTDPTIDAAQIEKFRAHADRIHTRGYERAKSSFIVGVTDVSAPILRSAAAVAALAVPFVHSTSLVMPIEEAIKHVRAAAARISASLILSEHHV
jgi:DNA-binding IclR family transcriptional regulator